MWETYQFCKNCIDKAEKVDKYDGKIPAKAVDDLDDPWRQIVPLNFLTASTLKIREMMIQLELRLMHPNLHVEIALHHKMPGHKKPNVYPVFVKDVDFDNNLKYDFTEEQKSQPDYV